MMSHAGVMSPVAADSSPWYESADVAFMLSLFYIQCIINYNFNVCIYRLQIRNHSSPESCCFAWHRVSFLCFVCFTPDQLCWAGSQLSLCSVWSALLRSSAPLNLLLLRWRVLVILWCCCTLYTTKANNFEINWEMLLLIYFYLLKTSVSLVGFWIQSRLF